MTFIIHTSVERWGGDISLRKIISDVLIWVAFLTGKSLSSVLQEVKKNPSTGIARKLHYLGILETCLFLLLMVMDLLCITLL